MAGFDKFSGFTDEEQYLELIIDSNKALRSYDLGSKELIEMMGRSASVMSKGTQLKTAP